jgi:PAS domain-containing protein
MSAPSSRPQADRRQLQQIIAGLSEGVLLLDPEGAIVWANEAALAAYGVAALGELGGTEAAFFERFDLHYRNKHELTADSFRT